MYTSSVAVLKHFNVIKAIKLQSKKDYYYYY